MDFLSSSIGFLIVIVLPMLLFFIYQVYNLIMISIRLKKAVAVETAKEAAKEAALAQSQVAELEEAKRLREEAEALRAKAEKELAEARKQQKQTESSQEEEQSHKAEQEETRS